MFDALSTKPTSRVNNNEINTNKIVVGQWTKKKRAE